MKSVCLVMFLCVSLVNAEDSGTGSGSEPAGTPPPASNGAASGETMELEAQRKRRDKSTEQYKGPVKICGTMSQTQTQDRGKVDCGSVTLPQTQDRERGTVALCHMQRTQEDCSTDPHTQYSVPPTDSEGPDTLFNRHRRSANHGDGTTFDPPQRFHESSGSHESHEFITDCAKTAACLAAKGKCQTAPCTVQQKRVHGGCTGSVCNCCAPRGCDPQPKCKKFGGFCALACGPGLQVVVGGCSGTCSCCAKPCGTSDECEDWHGVCQRNRCSSGQRELLDACPGQGCRCCSPAGPIRNVEGNSTTSEAINEAAGGKWSDVTQPNDEDAVKREEEDEEEEDIEEDEEESVDTD